jgi:hypothetical protein
LYTINPLAGAAIVVTSVKEVKAIRGNKNPRLDEFTSKIEEALGVVVPTLGDYR